MTTQALSPTVGSGQIAAGDLNADGIPDLVIVGVTQLALLYGTNTGVFAAPASLSPPPFMIFGSAPAIADTNGDNRADIWFRDSFNTTRLENAGGGAFTAALAGPSTNAFELGDFDEDGLIDFVFGTSAGLSFAKNDGAGGYAAPVPVFALASLAFITTGVTDFDGDGHLDVLARSFGTNVVALRGDGTGHFTLLQDLTGAFGTRHPIIVDVDGDRAPDVVLGSTGGASVPAAVRRNDGTGQFAAPQPVAGLVAEELAAADFDGDGLVDLVGVDATGFVLARGTGGGAFAPVESFPLGVVRGLAVGDIDGDGRVEAVTTDTAGANLMVLRMTLSAAAGLQAFGTGTGACAGTLGIAGSRSPNIGANDFRVLCSNAPPSGPGLLVIGTKVANGWDPARPRRDDAPRLRAAARHDAERRRRRSVDERADPGAAVPGRSDRARTVVLARRPAHRQHLQPGLFELASSRGLSITLQP